MLRFDGGFECRLEYARENEGPNGGGGGADRRMYASSDWMCAKCNINNFNRRATCFKCGTSRRDSDSLDAKGYNLVGADPCDSEFN